MHRNTHRIGGPGPALALLLALLAGAHAHSIESINLAWALQQTLQRHPALTTFALQVQRSEALIEQAAIRPQASIALEGENLLGNGLYRGSDRAEYTLTLSQLVELGGKRQRRVDLAQASLGSTQSEYELTRLDTLAETSRRYYALLRLQALAAWIDERASHEQEALRVIERRASAGAVGQADVSKMALRLARSRALHQQLDAELALARTRLAAMWLERAGFTRAAGELAAIPPLPDQRQVLAALERSPRLIRQTLLQRLADSRVELAEANGRIDLQLGLGIRQHQASNDQSLMFDISVPLQLNNPNRGRIAAARAERSLSRQQAEARQRELELALLQVRQQLANQHLVEQQLLSTLLPLARTQLAETERGYQRGRYSVLQWVDALRELYALQRELIEARTAMHLNLLELERITGEPLTTAAAATRITP